jgi:nicotinate-nucleotide adenylyltransferase
MNTRKTLKIALLGGTFDPVHNGHIFVAKHVRQVCSMDQVHLVTAGNPPHKLHQVTDAEVRHALVQAACEGEEGIVANRVELDRPGYTYTIDTIRHLKEVYAAGPFDVRISFITSAEYLDPENPHHIRKWKEADELLSLIDLIVTTRGQYGIEQTRQWAALHNLPSAQIIEIPTLPVTSYVVKTAMRAGQSIASLVPPRVATMLADMPHYH